DDCQGYLIDSAQHPFLNASGSPVSPYLASPYAPDEALALMSPVLPALAPGASTTFTFYYAFGDTGPPGFPAIGSIELHGAVNQGQTLTFTYHRLEDGGTFTETLKLSPSLNGQNGQYVRDIGPG